MRFGGFRRERECGPVVQERLVQLSRRHQRVREVVDRLHAIGADTQGLAVVCHREVGPALAHQQPGQVGVRLESRRRERERLAVV